MSTIETRSDTQMILNLEKAFMPLCCPKLNYNLSRKTNKQNACAAADKEIKVIKVIRLSTIFKF